VLALEGCPQLRLGLLAVGVAASAAGPGCPSSEWSAAAASLRA
jgi:hypothetical protein